MFMIQAAKRDKRMSAYFTRSLKLEKLEAVKIGGSIQNPLIISYVNCYKEIVEMQMIINW